jgi:protein involved in polysaccharide export with SLBB domain
MDPKGGLPEVILKAGGPTKRAALTRVSVTHRDHTTETVDISTALEANAPKLDFKVQQGDIVVVPANENKVLVTEAVVNPGYYPIPERGTLTLGDAILAAGGTKVGAKLKEVVILRRTPSGVEKNTISLDSLKNGVMNQDTILKTGDVVYVPSGRTGPSGIADATRTLGTVATLLRFGTLF